MRVLCVTYVPQKQVPGLAIKERMLLQLEIYTHILDFVPHKEASYSYIYGICL